MITPLRILLVGNYRLDGQMSMLRYYDLLLEHLPLLPQTHLTVEGIEPPAFFGKISLGPLTKWLRYLDKYLLFPRQLRRRLRHLSDECARLGTRAIVHTTDHSNAVYLSAARGLPHLRTLSTCHDLLAVRGALGEDTDCPASAFGTFLQHRILAALGQAHHVICVSRATQCDLQRLAPATSSAVIPLPLNQPYRVLPREETTQRLAASDSRLIDTPFLLHVGSSLSRKNREGILRIFASFQPAFHGYLVFAGEPLHPAQRALARDLGVADHIVEIVTPPGALLEALYNRAYAFVFPSKTEGFGWPIIEAQACGCPVLVARTTSLPEVTGDGGFVRELQDEPGFVADLLSLKKEPVRAEIIALGFSNLLRFDRPRILADYAQTYHAVAGKKS